MAAKAQRAVSGQTGRNFGEPDEGHALSIANPQNSSEDGSC
jgi:hypothetical protein